MARFQSHRFMLAEPLHQQAQCRNAIATLKQRRDHLSVGLGRLKLSHMSSPKKHITRGFSHRFPFCKGPRDMLGGIQLFVSGDAGKILNGQCAEAIPEVRQLLIALRDRQFQRLLTTRGGFFKCSRIGIEQRFDHVKQHFDPLVRDTVFA